MPIDSSPWDALAAGATEPADVTRRLRDVAALTLGRRVLHLGVVEPLLLHAHPEVRAAAVAALAGADGVRAIRALVARLDDADAAVRAEAVAALHASSHEQPARFAHALFHGREDVRVRALSLGAPAGAGALLLHAAAAAPASLPLADVLEVGWDEAIRSCAFTRGRSDAEVERALIEGDVERPAAEEPEAAGAGQDAFDDLFHRLRDVRRDADDRTLADALACWPTEVQHRAVVSLLAVARRHRSWTARYARACTRAFPGFLRWSSVPRAVRRAAVGVFHDAGSGAPALDDELVRGLLEDPLFVDDAGLLDLWAVAALLRCVKRGAIRKARRWLGTPRILRAMAADPLGALAWVDIEDDSARGRADLLRMARRAHPDATARLLAGATLVESDAGKERLLAELDGYDSALVLAHAVDLELAGVEVRAGPRLAALLAPRVAPDWMLTLLRPLVAHPDLAKSSVAATALRVLWPALDAERLAELEAELSPGAMNVVRTLLGPPQRDTVHAMLAGSPADAPPSAPRAPVVAAPVVAAPGIAAAGWSADRVRGADARAPRSRAAAAASAEPEPEPEREREGAPIDGAPAAYTTQALRSLLLAGPRVTRPGAVMAWLDGSAALPAEERLEAHEAIAADGSGVARRAALRALGAEGARGRAHHVRALADAWSWGTAVASRLTGRPIDIRFLTGAHLGHTRFDEPVIHVSAEPILARVPHGRDIVEGLILHELGHRLFHAGPEGARVWREAHAERIGGLLNLIADEHLERRLRALDAGFGDRLKRLAAWAFLHRPRELDVFALCATLGARAGRVLASTSLGVARSGSRVVVESGALLAALERGGHAFARFVRALRMGLGNRHRDPLVARALAEVAGGAGARSLKDREVGDLLGLARALQEIFGWQARLAESVGGHESLADAAEADSESVDDDEIRAAARARAGFPTPAHMGTGGGAGAIDVSPDERFVPLRAVDPLTFDPHAHAPLAAAVARPARQLRQQLHASTTSVSVARSRLRGRFDPGRARALVTRGDPRMMAARRAAPAAGVFLGVLVDCSSSMDGRHLDRAKLFAAVLAEAARGMVGVELRIWGFTDEKLLDAGDAHRCAAHALVAAGGNNDAGALWYASQVARRSCMRRRVLLMISDGLPTECSTSALRALVGRLGSRAAISCAQVAMQPLREVCFPEHVVLEDEPDAVTVARFAAIAGELVRRTPAR
jgi:hypothetical protein